MCIYVDMYISLYVKVCIRLDIYGSKKPYGLKVGLEVSATIAV